VAHQRVAEQAQEVGELQHVLVAPAAVGLVDRAEHRVVQHEVTGLQHRPRQRGAAHQFAGERVVVILAHAA
jgi:hypothetical protein